MIILPTARAQVTPRVGGGGGGSWTPALISSDILGWWDVSEPATVSTIPASGGMITQIAAKGGYGTALTAESGREPSVQLADLNSLDTMTLAGGKRLASVFSARHQQASLTVVVIAKAPTSGSINYNRLVGLPKNGTTADSAGGDSISALLRSGSDNHIASYRGEISNAVAGTMTGGWQIFSFQWGGGSVSLTLDADTANPTNMDATTPIDADRLWVGDNFPEDGAFWNSPVAEIVALKTGALVNTQKIQGYLAHKWGLTANLASDHPYKSSPPPLIANTEVNNWISAVVAAGGTVTSTTQAAVDNFVTGCKTDGIWTKLSGGLILPFASDGFSGVFAPLIVPSGGAITNNDFVSGDYSLSTGLDPGSSNSSKYLTTNVLIGAIGTSTSIQFSSYQRIIRSGENTVASSELDAPAGRVILHAGFSGTDYWDSFSADSGSGGRISFTTGSAGLVSGSRTSTGSAIYRRGIERASTSGSGGSFPSDKNLLIFAFASGTGGGAKSTYEKSVTSYFYAGPGLTSSEEANHNTRVQTLQTALGRQV